VTQPDDGWAPVIDIHWPHQQQQQQQQQRLKQLCSVL